MSFERLDVLCFLNSLSPFLCRALILLVIHGLNFLSPLMVLCGICFFISVWMVVVNLFHMVWMSVVITYSINSSLNFLKSFLKLS